MSTLNNQNAAKHYMRAALPKLPPKTEHIRRQSGELRSALESTLVSRSRTIGVWEACVISAICRWFRHGALAARWLRLQEAELAPADRLRFSEAVAKSGNEVVRLLGVLKLDRDASDSIYDALYSTPQPALTPPTGGNGETCQGAPGSAAGGGDGDTVEEPAGPSGDALGHETGHDATGDALEGRA